MSDLVLARPGIASAAEAHWGGLLPLGIGYLAAAAREHGLRVAVVDGKLSGHTRLEETAKAILNKRPVVVGFSALTCEYSDCAELARQLKANDPKIVTVLGGAHANALPVESLLEAPAIDFVLAGEGESSLVALVDALRNGEQPTDIPGLHYRSNGESGNTPAPQLSGAGEQTVIASPPPYAEDPAHVPFPAWDLFPRSDTFPILTERGCPFACVFCSHNMSRKVRARSPAHVIEELRWLKADFDPRRINFEDDTFGLRSADTSALLEQLIDFNRGGSIQFKAQTRVDQLKKPMLTLMRRAGFDFLELGVESGDPEVLDRSGKGVSLNAVDEAVRLARAVGIKVWLKFIIGLPGENRETVRRTIDLAVRLNPDRMSVSVIVPYPGSQIYNWALRGENGYRFVSQNWNQFDKYAGASVELQTLDYRTMRRLQGRMYAEVYLRNGRFRELAKMIWNHRALACKLGRGMFSKGSA